MSKIIKRRYWLFVVLIACATSLDLYLFLTPPGFKATGTTVVDTRKIQVVRQRSSLDDSVFRSRRADHVAEALLGQMLFWGCDGVQPQRPRGLMWLTLAREAAIDSKKDKWIIDLYEKAVASANDEDRQDALLYLENHLKRHN